MTDIKWGAGIYGATMETLNLLGDTPVAYGDPDDWLESETYSSWGYNSSGLYHLPEDHPYYLATEKGFTYWPGGDGAPGDWEPGSPVLFRNGDQPKQGEWAWGPGDGDYIIIGYKRKAEALPTDTDTVTIKLMTERQWRDLIISESGLADFSRAANSTIRALRTLGIIREETRAERFARETGYVVTEAVDAALEWAANNPE